MTNSISPLSITVRPAYGRDYNSGEEALKDWHDGKDFIVTGIHKDAGKYVNKEDAERYKITTVLCHYNMAYMRTVFLKDI